ncbi:MAG: hypothetical protein AABY22_03965 [Nanoarchaeota archaeon]
MITYLELKTNKRYPSHGCECGFDEKNGKLKYFIRGFGWRTAKKNQFEKQEIPDLIKHFTENEWKEYALQYGIPCAQEFLDSCDYMKPSVAYQIFNPPKNKEVWNNLENQLWFKSIFKSDMNRFICGTSIALGNTYALDILKFENHLAYEF